MNENWSLNRKSIEEYSQNQLQGPEVALNLHLQKKVEDFIPELWTLIWLGLWISHPPFLTTRLPKIGMAQICLLLLTMEMLIAAHSVILNWSLRLAGNSEWGGFGAGGESGEHDWSRGHHPHQENIETAQTNGNNDPWWGNNGEGSPGSWLVLDPSHAGCLAPLGISPAPDTGPRSNRDTVSWAC